MTIRSGSGIGALSADYLFESGFLVVTDRDVHAYRRTESRAALDRQRAADRALGLRAGEVAGLDLGDIRWRQGEIVVRGKGSRRDILPLPADAGEAVAGWLAGGRPRAAACPAVFVRLPSPHGRLASGSVSYVVRRACARAGITAAGAH
jgi:integrase